MEPLEARTGPTRPPSRGLRAAAAAVLALLAAAGAAPAQDGGEEPGEAPATSYRMAWGAQTAGVEDGVFVGTFTEGVVLRRGTFSIEARSLVLWGDAAEIRSGGGRLADLVGTLPEKGPAPEARPAPAPPPGPPGPRGGSSFGGSPELRHWLGTVLHALYAEGDVVFRMGDRTIRTERLVVDFRRDLLATGKVQVSAGLGLPDRGMSLPLVIRAARMHRTAADTLLLENATYSTCEFEEPHFLFRCTELTLREDEGATAFTAWHNVVEVGGVPVFYLPVLGGRSDWSARPLRSVNLRSSSRFGTEVLLGWGGEISLAGEKWGDWMLHTDVRSRRGPGAGFDLDYARGPYRGALQSYYQRDTALLDGFDDSRVPRDDRGRVRWEHLHELGRRWRLQASLFDFSDRNFQREYLKDEFQEERDPETYLSLQRREGTDRFSLDLAPRLDDFTTRTETLPAATFARAGAPLPVPRPLAGLLDGADWSLDASAGAYERERDEALGVRSDRVLREDAAVRLGGVRGVGPVRLLPFAVAGATRWQGGGGLPGAGGHHARGDLAAGARAVLEARGAWPDFRIPALGVDGVRHLATFDLGWMRRWSVTGDPGEVDPVDAVDALDEAEVLSLRWRNRLQVDAGGRQVDWLDLELRALYFPDPLARRAPFLGWKEEGIDGLRGVDFPGEPKYRAAPLRGPWGPYEADLRMRLRENLFLLAEAEYDPYEQVARTAAFGARWFVLPVASIYAGDRKIAGDSDVVTLRADWAVSERWYLGASRQADLRRSEHLGGALFLRRVFHDFVLEISYRSDATSGDRSVRFSLVPAALWVPPTSGERWKRLDYDAQRWYR